ncbi:MAG TPA: EAL domain-containing protein [Ideonella sp.]|uniref:EAL domain-containing response regulator n=1 Tax=Ideonella sp. TaxID=1929293 RepID=UPI002E304724|nr:EAL domain-containing protein [Ideonella sp.]HEX5684177.1 EAL domain-containing protein [Ideonella sp.]
MTGIKLTVLIVDDTPENIDVLSAVLEGMGCELMVATNGPRALELAARRAPDLILLDVMMPGMDGFEVCRRLKADMALAEIPVIFVTARTDDISTGFGVGGSDYITKPINTDEVLARVRHQIERQVLLRDLRELNRSLEERVRERTAELTLANRQLRVEINERRYMQDRLNYLATHDFVTRQYNRGALDAHVSELLARIQRQATAAVFLLIDIDQFRLVNETCGCVAGDELLRQFAELVSGALQRSDFFARLGGDKFAVVSEDQSEEGGTALARHIHKQISEFEFQWEERVFKLAASIAVVRIQRDIVSFDQLMLMADEAAYLAKREGRGAICVYDPKRSASDPQRESINWALVLFDALKENRLRLYGQRLQPLGAPSGAPARLHIETLARLWDPVREKLLMPAHFIAPAERFHLVIDIDRWMIGQVVALLGEVPDLHDQIGQIAVNLSAITIRDAGLCDHVGELLAKHRVPGRLLCFEITETEAITNLQSASSFMQNLRDLGCRFSLDDFGSGFASFTYLRRLPFDSIKIDGMFVRDMDTDDVHSGMVRSMAEMGRLLNKPIVAECVENERVAAMLRSLGIDWAQGYLYHQPEALTPQLLREWLGDASRADAQKVA